MWCMSGVELYDKFVCNQEDTCQVLHNLLHTENVCLHMCTHTSVGSLNYAVPYKPIRQLPLPSS